MSKRLKSKKISLLYIMNGVVFLLVIAILIPTIASGVKPISAIAAPNSLKVSVKQILLPALNQDRTFNYKLEALEAENPMPAGAKGNGYEFSITGNTVEQFSFSKNLRPGRFTYQLYQVIDEKQSLEPTGVIYDRANYRLELIIDSEGVESLIAYCEDGSKVSEIYFENDYTQKEVELPPPNKPTNPNPSGPKDRETVVNRELPQYPGKRPITGDVNDIGLWLGLSGGATVIFILALILLKKRKGNETKEKLRELIDL